MCVDCQISIIIISLLLVSVCCVVWLCREFVGFIRWMTARVIRELEEEDKG